MFTYLSLYDKIFCLLSLRNVLKDIFLNYNPFLLKKRSSTSFKDENLSTIRYLTNRYVKKYLHFYR